MKFQYRKRAYDGRHAIWRHEPDEERASPWVCVAVVASAKDALDWMRQQREAA